MIESILQNIGLTLQTLGSIFIGYAALRVHHRVLMEHRVDKKVFRTMRGEQIVGWVGVVLLVLGYVLIILGF